MRAQYQVIGFVVLLAVAVPAAVAAAQHGAGECRVSPADLAVAVARHEAFLRALERERHAGIEPPPVKSHAAVRQAGDIAVIEDDGNLFVRPKTVDLQRTSIQYLRRPKGVSAVRSHLDFKSVLGTRLELGDDAAVLVEFPEDFEYPFGEEVYTRAWVHSDGHVTFGEPDTSTSDRSPRRFLDGPPRLAPLFTDLDPSAAGGEGGVYLNFLPGRVRVTWYEVPEFGRSNPSTVQLTLFETGRAAFVYGDRVEATAAVVGVNPWGGAAPLHLMDYNEELPFRPQRVAIAEWFPVAGPQIDELSIAIRFYQHFHDVYDQLVVWYDFPFSLGTNVLGGSLPIKNDVQGLGDELYDFTDLVDSDGRLQRFVQMAGSVVDSYPDDPDDPIFRGGESTMSLVGHEVGHRWLAAMRMRNADGEIVGDLLGRSEVHWSFYVDTDASLLEGNEILDNNDGTFQTLAPVSIRYSALDQYAMGLIPPRDVPPFFYVFDPSSVVSRGSNPRARVRFSGERVDVTLGDVIAAVGPRVPAAAEAPKVFRIAFVLVGAPGEEVSQAGIDKLERFRKRFEGFFEEAAGGNGRVDTELVAR